MMNIVFRRLAMPGLLLTLLAGCNAGNPNPPVFNMALSQPLLEFTLNAGQTTSGYVYYEYATGENIAGNTDSLAGVNIDTTGKTGLLTLAPPVNQIPGIYFLTIDAINTTNTSGIIAVVNVLPPGQPANPTLVNFPMGGNTTRRAVVTLFVARNEISATYAPELVTPAPALASPASEGVTVNGIYSTLNTGSNTYMIQADITVSTAALQGNTNSVTASDGNTYSNGITLQFNATPTTANDYTYTPYSEMIYLNPI